MFSVSDWTVRGRWPVGGARQRDRWDRDQGCGMDRGGVTRVAWSVWGQGLRTGSVWDDRKTFLHKGTLQLGEFTFVLNLVVPKCQLHAEHNHFFKIWILLFEFVTILQIVFHCVDSNGQRRLWTEEQHFVERSFLKCSRTSVVAHPMIVVQM